MKVTTARNIAIEWVLKNAPVTGEITGAFFHGSINWMDGDDILPSSSDVDIVLVTKQVLPSLSKFSYRDILLDISGMASHEIARPEQVLDKYYLAGDFRANNIIYDSQNKLQHIQQEVEKVYLQKDQRIRRCRLALDHAENTLKGIHTAAALPDRFTSWIFARGILTHVLLNAAVRNPTVRRRYLDTKILLTGYGYTELYEELLQLQGFDQFSKEQTWSHLRSLSEVFDIAASVIRSPYRFAGDITAYSKRIAVGGSEELINAGHHREAMFWICACFARCMHVINQDGETRSQVAACQSRFDALIADLKPIPGGDLMAGNRNFENLVPKVWDTAMKIIDG